ncbi:MAG: hypothetical protein SFU27_08450 [Thermonemataceae bacterium]|nr:hypothetical protein [Thermonemataceae bacterium]
MKRIFLTLLLVVAGSYTIMAQKIVDSNGSGSKYDENCYYYIKGVKSQVGQNIYCKAPYDDNCFIIVVPCPQAKTLSEDTPTILRIPFGKNFVDIPIKSNYKIEKMLDGSTKLSYELE